MHYWFPKVHVLCHDAHRNSGAEGRRGRGRTPEMGRTRGESLRGSGSLSTEAGLGDAKEADAVHASPWSPPRRGPNSQGWLLQDSQSLTLGSASRSHSLLF